MVTWHVTPLKVFSMFFVVYFLTILGTKKELIAPADDQFTISPIPLGVMRVVYDSFPIGRSPNCFKQSLHSCIELVVILVKMILYAVCSVVSIREYPAFFTKSNANNGCSFNPMQRQITVCNEIFG